MKDGDLLLTITRKEPLSAKYIKVHSKFDDRNAKLDPIKNKSEFTNQFLPDMITVYRRESEATIRYHYDSVGNRIIKWEGTSTLETTKYKYGEETNQLLSNGKYGYKYDSGRDRE